MMVYIIVLTLLFGFSIVLISLTIYQRKRWVVKNRQFYISKWREINVLVNTNPKLAILEADKLLDHLLKEKGFSGSLGEKLKKANKLLRNPDNIWKAHKERNKIAHELNYNINIKKTRYLLEIYKQTYKDLGLKIKN